MVTKDIRLMATRVTKYMGRYMKKTFSVTNLHDGGKIRAHRRCIENVVIEAIQLSEKLDEFALNASVYVLICFYMN